MATCDKNAHQLVAHLTNRPHEKQQFFDESFIAHLFRALTRVIMVKNCKKNFCDSHFLNIVAALRTPRTSSPYRSLHDKQTTHVPQEPSITKAPLATSTDCTLTRREMCRGRQDDVRTHAGRQVRAWFASSPRHQSPRVSLQVVWLVPRWVKHLTF